MKISFLLKTGVIVAAMALAGCQTAGSGTNSTATISKQGDGSAYNNTESTLAKVKARGYLNCGVSQGIPGFSEPNDQGRWAGFDVDFCRAVAAAIFGDGDKVRFVPASAKIRFTILQAGEVDLLARNTTWTYTRDTALGLQFTAVNFYGGQGFMVPKSLGAARVTDLSKSKPCLVKGDYTTTRLEAYFKKHSIDYVPSYWKDARESVAAYDSGQCNVFTTDRSALAINRLRFSNPDDHMVLPEVISREPLTPLVREGDDQWVDLIRWTISAMILAEQEGVTSKNINSSESSSREINRILGKEGWHPGESFGLSRNWVKDVIQSVGNYGEVYDRYLGPNTPYKLERSINALWTDGGLMYPFPMR